MGKTLIIAEKPSVAGDISKALGKFEKTRRTSSKMTNMSSRRRSAICLQSAVPEQFEVKRGKWTFANLPVIPPHFDLLPIEKNEARLKVLVKLIKRKDVDRAHQCLRRRARRRIDFPLHRPIREGQAADPAALAAIHDAGCDPRRLRTSAHGRRDDSAGGRRDVPQRERLAGRHQRHARDDGVQFQDRRFSSDDGWPRADADAGDSGRARGED